MSGWIDISVPLRSGMVRWPGDPEVKIERVLDMDRGDRVNLSAACFGLHSGTHMDAPLHFLRDGRGIEEMPPDATVGRARVIGIEDRESVKLPELEPHDIRAGERILFKTGNSGRCWGRDEFVEDFVHISKEAARYLAERRIAAVGIDYLSVGGFQKDGEETHRILLSAGIWIIEGLDLSKVAAGGYELICLPLKVMGADGAPARALLRAM
jgi:arylformamidase